MGNVRGENGELATEVYIVDLPDEVTRARQGRPLEGSVEMRPAPPVGANQRRLTFTLSRRYPGVQGMRHFPRTSPDGSKIAFKLKDDDGLIQLFTVSPRGGEPVQLTRNAHSVETTFNWSPDGKFVVFGMDGSLCVAEVPGGFVMRLTKPSETSIFNPQFSNTGRWIAYNRMVAVDKQEVPHIFLIDFSSIDQNPGG
jgi:hypothetical protein